jgi:serine/threonine protein kinase
MGDLMSKFCCISNNDIIGNTNYGNSLNASTNNLKESSYFHKSESELLPMSQIRLPNLQKVLSSSLSITSKYAIIKKEGSPLADYDIISQIGEGAYGKVYKVRNKKNKKLRAMKEINGFNLNENKIKKIMSEIEILKNLDHIYIIKLYEYYIDQNCIYLINELSNEGDLQSKFWKIKIFPEFVVKIIMLQIFKALMYLNERRIIHGDLKLENILVINYKNENLKDNKNEDGFIEAIKHDMKIMNKKVNHISKIDNFEDSEFKFIKDLKKDMKENHQKVNINSYATTLKFKNDNFHILENQEKNALKFSYKNKKDKLHIYNYGIKLIDFGCSKIFNRVKKNFCDVIGTLVYCSPEVLLNNYDKSCDIWSCGVIMYYLLSGQFPFEGKTEQQIISKIIEAKLEFNDEHFNNISEEAKELIRKCLQYQPNKRITLPQVLNHKFFDEIQESLMFTEEEIKKLKHLKEISKKTKFYQLVLTNLSYNFSDNKLLDKLNSLYNKIDKNSDYKITKAELSEAYKHANIQISHEELDEIVKSMDFNSNGIIDYEEFIRICIPNERLFTEENLKNIFSTFDTDNKGFITPQKIIDFIESTKHISENLKSQIKNEIMDIADEIIDFDDFKNLMWNLSQTDS